MEGPKGVPNWGGGARGMQKLEAGNRNGQPHIAENIVWMREWNWGSL